MFKLRYYQDEAKAACHDAWNRHRSTSIILPTAVGKTETYLSIGVEEPGRVMVLVHRDYLITSPVERLKRVGFDDVAVEKGNERAERNGRRAHMVFASVQSIGPESQWGRLATFDPKEFSLLIIDEGHRAVSPTYRRVIEFFLMGNPKCKVLILTATPKRKDGLALGNVCESVAYTMTPADAVAEGWIVPPRFFRREVPDLDFTAIKVKAGDLDADAVAKLLEEEKPLHEVCASLTADEGPTIVFCPKVSVAMTYAALVNKRYRPGRAACLHEGSDDIERERATKGLADGSIDWVFNVDLLTEGFDVPRVVRVAWAAPTMSLVKWTQGCGRGFRVDGSIAPLLIGGKGDAEIRRRLIAESAKPQCDIVTYFPSNCQHQICTAVDLLGGDDLPPGVKEMAGEVEKQTATAAGGSNTAADIETAAVLVDLRTLLDERRKSLKAKAVVADMAYDGMGGGSTRSEKDGGRAAGQRMATAAVSSDWPAGEAMTVRQANWFGYKRIAVPEGMTKCRASIVRDLIDLTVPPELALSYGRRQALAVRSKMEAKKAERQAIPA